MWDYRYLKRVDFRTVPIILALMTISILIIVSMTSKGSEIFLTKAAKIQIQWFMMGWVIYFFCVGFDYRKFRTWAWILYIVTILLLIGLFFTTPIQNVQRW